MNRVNFSSLRLNKIINQVYDKQYFKRDIFTELNSLIYSYVDKHLNIEGQSSSEIAKSIEIKTLIKQSPETVLRMFEPLVQIIIRRYVFDKNIHEDVRQHIYLELLERRFKYIQENYRPSVPFVYYISKIIMNICISYRSSSQIESIPLPEETYQEAYDVEAKLEYSSLLSDLLVEYRDSKPLFLFKIQNDYRVSKDEIKKQLPLISTWDLNKYVDVLNTAQQNKTELLNQLFNKYERKNNKSSSIRKTISLFQQDVYRKLCIILNTDAINKDSINYYICTLLDQQLAEGQ